MTKDYKMAKFKDVSVLDYEPYAELKARHAGLVAMLASLNESGSPEELRRKAVAADVQAMEMEAAALIEPKLESKAKAARNEAREKALLADDAERQAHIIRIALQRLEPELQRTKEIADAKVIDVIRPEHEKLVVKIIDAIRKYNTVLEEEQELCSLLFREVGSTACITSVTRLLGANNAFGKVQPGSEKNQHSQFYAILNKLRSSGYNV